MGCYSTNSPYFLIITPNKGNIMRKSFLVIASLLLLLLLLLSGCGKGWERDVAISNADMDGADWIVAQDSNDGKVYRCWKLHDVSVAPEEHTDGIHWLDSNNHIVHVSGWYNRISVVGGKWEEAAKQIDVDLTKCHEG